MVIRKDGRDAVCAAVMDCGRVLSTKVNGGGWTRDLRRDEIEQVLRMLAIRFGVGL